MPSIVLTKVSGYPLSLSSTTWTPISYDDRQNIQHAVANELKGPGIEITKIEVMCRARNSSSSQKKLQFGFKPALTSGRNTWATYGGGNVLDSAFVAVDGSSNGSYINRTFTRVYDANTNAAAFAKFAGHILESFNNDTDIFFSIIQPASGFETQIYMSGYWTITITYNILGNVPTTNVNTAVVGATPITTTIDKIVPDSTTTLNYKYGNTVLKTVNLAAGTSDVYTPPEAVATAHFPNDPTGTLTIEAKTYLDGVEYGTVITTVTLTLPASAAPTCLCTPTMPVQVISGVNAYVQNQSGVQFSVSGSAKLGASIAGYSLSFDGAIYDTFPAVIPLITHSGTLHYTLTVTDSRGLTGTNAGYIYVHPWQKPTFLVGFACARATTTGDIDDDAESVLYTMSVVASPIEVGGVQHNTLSYQIKSRALGTETWIVNDPVYAPSGAYSMNPEELIMRGGNIAVYTAYQGYEFLVVVQDRFDSAQGEYTIPTNKRQFVLGQDGESMSFGGAIVPGFITFYHPIEGLPSYSAERVYTGQRWLSGRKIYRKTFIFGSMATSGALDIPIGEAAIEEVVSLRGTVGTSGGTNLELLPFTHQSNITYQKGLTVSSLANNPFIAIRMGSGSTAPVGGYVVIEYVPIDPATQWSKPYMTAASEAGCIVSASSADSATYAALKGFSVSPTEYWVSTLADAERWIQMQMPGSRTNIVLYICNQNTASGYPSVKSGIFYGSNDGATWDEIGSFSDRPDNLNFALTVHHLKNQTPYSYIRIKITSPGANVDKARIGRISVFGDIA